MNRGVLFWAMIVSAIVGLSMSAYLTYLSLVPPTSCPVGEYSIFSCNEVIYSKYAHFYGISVALLGLGWFVIALGLIMIAWHDSRFIRGVVLWSVLGAVGVAGFVYTEIFLLGSVCLLCTVAHVMGLAILGLSIACMRSLLESSEPPGAPQVENSD
jgi:uncharacterized membrane protein